MAELTVQTITAAAGLAPTMEAGTASMDYLNTNGNVSLVIMNVGTGAKALTFDVKGTVGVDGMEPGKTGGNAGEFAFTIPVSTTVPFIISPRQTQFYNDSADNMVDFTLDVTTDITIAAVIIE